VAGGLAGVSGNRDQRRRASADPIAFAKPPAADRAGAPRRAQVASMAPLPRPAFRIERPAAIAAVRWSVRRYISELRAVVAGGATSGT